jgi:hypothetical protein
MHISSPYCGRFQPPTGALRNLEDYHVAVPQQDLQSLNVNYCRAEVCSTEAYSADKLLLISTEEQFTANIAAPNTNSSIDVPSTTWLNIRIHTVVCIGFSGDSNC